MPRSEPAVQGELAFDAAHVGQAAFEARRRGGEDDPDAVRLTTTVDLDDPDEVLDLVISRVMELQVEEKLPLYVIPVRTPERAAGLRRVVAQSKLRHGSQSPPL